MPHARARRTTNPRRRKLAAGAAVIALATPATARASPVPLARSSLVVERADVDLRCTADDCAFATTYHLFNPGDATEVVRGAFFGIRAELSAVEAEGIDARAALAPDEEKTIRATVVELEPDLARGEVELAAAGFAIAVDPSRRKTLTFVGRLRPAQVQSSSGGFFSSPIATRHPFLGSESSDAERRAYVCALFPIRTWSGAPPIGVSARLADGLGWDGPDVAWEVRHEGGEQVIRASVPASDAGMLRFGIVRHASVVTPGGPFAGVGPRLDAEELRLRAGYELGIGSSLIASVACRRAPSPS